MPEKGLFNVKIIGEIGINHNGSLELAKDLIVKAAAAGCDYVKFQKRNPDVCVPEEQKGKMRDTPWGEMRYIDYKYKTEFGAEEYNEIDRFCREIGISWFASVWDKDSVDFMSNYTTSVSGADQSIMKIPSALITDKELTQYAREKCDILIISTGMSTQEEIDDAYINCSPDVVMHTNSTYPTPIEELNLNYIKTLTKRFVNAEIGYSGHEYGLVTTFATIPLGVKWVERHITIDRSLWGSDQSASIEPSGLVKLVKGIRDIEKAMSTPEQNERILFEGELAKRKSLRGE